MEATCSSENSIEFQWNSKRNSALLATCLTQVSYFVYSSTLKMEATCSSENSTEFQWNSKRNSALLATRLTQVFLLHLFFDHEDGGNMFLRTFEWISTEFTALYEEYRTLQRNSIDFSIEFQRNSRRYMREYRTLQRNSIQFLIEFQRNSRCYTRIREYRTLQRNSIEFSIEFERNSRHYIREYRTLDNHDCENLKCYKRTISS
jgi:hypothetical protein